MLVDSDRIIKMANMYTDESLTTFKKLIDTIINDTQYKVHKLESVIDEEIDKIKKTKIGRDELDNIENAIISKIDLDYIQELVDFKGFASKKLETILTKVTSHDEGLQNI